MKPDKIKKCKRHVIEKVTFIMVERSQKKPLCLVLRKTWPIVDTANRLGEQAFEKCQRKERLIEMRIVRKKCSNGMVVTTVTHTRSRHRKSLLKKRF